MVKVRYLYHSGYWVELAQTVLVFDYYKGELPPVPAGKKLFVFVSHKHQDHFQPAVLRWAEKEGQGDARYFFGNDVKLNAGYLERYGIPADLLQRAVRVRPGEAIEYDKEQLHVEALRSTDQGVAFLVRLQEINIYHAGDLNHWYWEEESPAWNRQMEQDYHTRIDQLEGEHFQLAFIPLDPRLGKGFGYGMDYFLQKVNADYIFPMHMWEDYQIISRYKKTELGQRFAEKIADVSEQNREFVIEK